MSSPYDLYGEVICIFLLCINVVAHFISVGLCKPHPYFWLPRTFYNITLLKIPNRIPQMKSEFEMSWVCPSLISSRHIPLIFLEEAILCTSTHHLCSKYCYFNETSHSFTTLITIDPSFPIFGYAVFSHVEWGSIVVFSIQCHQQ